MEADLACDAELLYCCLDFTGKICQQIMGDTLEKELAVGVREAVDCR